jgi:hypothetical protein
MNQVVYVQAYFAPVGRTEVVKVATGEKTEGLFGREKPVTREQTKFVTTGTSPCVIDAQRLANDVAAAVAKLNEQDCEVVDRKSVV